LWRCTCGVKIAKKGCNSSSITTLNTLWYVHSTIFFLSYYFLELNLMIFIFISRRHITAGWGRDTGMILDFDLNLQIEAGSSSGPNRNQVYELSNTTAKNLRMARSVSIVGSSQSVSSIQSQEFAALQQHMTHLTEKYEWLSVDYEQLRQMVMDMRSQMGGTCAIPFWPYGPENDQPPPSPALPLF